MGWKHNPIIWGQWQHFTSAGALRELCQPFFPLRLTNVKHIFHLNPLSINEFSMSSHLKHHAVFTEITGNHHTFPVVFNHAKKKKKTPKNLSVQKNCLCSQAVMWIFSQTFDLWFSSMTSKPKHDHSPGEKKKKELLYECFNTCRIGSQPGS